MADIRVNTLPEQSPSLDDHILAIKESGSYQALVSDVAKKIIEEYAGTPLAGSNQSIANALASLGGPNNIVGASNKYGWTALTNGQDLNEILTVGVYVATSNTIATSLLNCPARYAFKMTVESITGNYVRQTITAYRTATDSMMNEQWYREYNPTSATWGDWKAVPTRREITALDTLANANNIVGANNGQGWTLLSSGQDLNAIVTFGVYFANSVAIASSLLNAPTKPLPDAPFKLIVEKSGSSAKNIRQTIIQPQLTEAYGVNRTERKWVRQTLDTQTWSEWYFMPTRSEVNAIANAGAKNLLRPTRGTTINGVTFDVNLDGSVTVNGTASADALYYVGTLIDCTGITVTLTGCPESGSDSTYYQQVVQNSSNRGFDTGSGVTVAGTTNMRARIVVRSGVTVDNVTFYPMLRDAAILDDTYVPYSLSNAELTKKTYGYLLSEGADLNDFVTDMSCVVSTPAIAQTILNTPGTLSAGFTLDVISKGATAYQILYLSGFDAGMFVRSSTSSGWRPWKQVSLIDV